MKKAKRHNPPAIYQCERCKELVGCKGCDKDYHTICMECRGEAHMTEYLKKKDVDKLFK